MTVSCPRTRASSPHSSPRCSSATLRSSSGSTTPQHRLQRANERPWSGLAPDAFGVPGDSAAAAIGSSPIAALTRDGGLAANSQALEALKHVRWTIHRAFCRYQSACEERRQLAVEVGELSQQLTDALCAAGWSAPQAQQANVHELARVAV